MLRLFAIALLVVSANCCLPTQSTANVTLETCQEALEPAISVGIIALGECVAEQAGVQETVNNIEQTKSISDDILAILEANGLNEAALQLRACYAREIGLLNDDGTFNMDKLKELLLEQVESGDLLSNTQLGIDECPVVVDYNIQDYLLCVANYCWQGAEAGASAAT